jgi:hypothetical protein
MFIVYYFQTIDKKSGQCKEEKLVSLFWFAFFVGQKQYKIKLTSGLGPSNENFQIWEIFRKSQKILFLAFLSERLKNYLADVLAWLVY